MEKSVTLYKNIDTGDCFFQPMTKHPIGASVEMGTPIRVRSNNPADIAKALSEAFANYGEKYDQKYVQSRDVETQREFSKSHISVTVYELGARVEVVPMQRNTKGGYESFGKKAVIDNLKDEQSVAEVLERALSQAR
jgi:hypothetical protein